MKTALIIIVVLVILSKIFKNTKTYNEAKIIAELKQYIDSESLLKGLAMNSVREKATHLLISGKISEEFYQRTFCGGDAENAWWEVNRKNIKG